MLNMSPMVETGRACSAYVAFLQDDTSLEMAITATLTPSTEARVGLPIALFMTMTVQRSPLAGRVIACAITVHRHLGPGLFESTCQCFAHELSVHGIRCQWQAPVPIRYADVILDCGYRVDCIVENQLVVELKAVERILPIHHAQVLTDLKLLEMRQGLLSNFNSHRLVDGLKSFLLDRPDAHHGEHGVHGA